MTSKGNPSDDASGASLPEIDLDTISLLVPQVREGSSAARDQLLEHVQEFVQLMARQNAPDHLRGKFGTFRHCAAVIGSSRARLRRVFAVRPRANSTRG